MKAVGPARGPKARQLHREAAQHLHPSARMDGSRGRGGCGRAFVVEVGTGRGRRRRNLHRWTSSYRPHQRTPASEQTASAAPLPLIRNTWLPIMTPLLSCRAEQGCEGHIYVYHRRVRTLSCSEGKYRRWRLLSRVAALQPQILYHHACTSKGMYQPFLDFYQSASIQISSR